MPVGAVAILFGIGVLVAVMMMVMIMRAACIDAAAAMIAVFSALRHPPLPSGPEFKTTGLGHG
jgi:hypothetical protein